MSTIKNKYFTNNNIFIIIYGDKGGIYMKNKNLNNTYTLMNIKNQKVILYLTKIIMQLNYSCNNIIPDEKFQRAIVMFTNRNEDFETIINNSLSGKEIKNIKLIPTGWTNIVYEVETNDGNYFFRFPRDEFWSRTIVKDYEFAKYIKNPILYAIGEKT